MKNRIKESCRVLLAAMSVCWLAACSPQQQDESKTFTSEEKTQVSNEVVALLGAYNSDIREGGLMTEFKYLLESPDFFWVPPGYGSALSYDSVKTIITQNAPSLARVDNTWDTLRVVPLSKTSATYTGRLKSVVTDTSGQVFESTLLETGVLIKTSEGWKLLGGQSRIIEN